MLPSEPIARKANCKKYRCQRTAIHYEKIMQNVMFQVPSMHDVSRCIVTEEVVSSGKQPVLVHGKKAEPAASHAAADAEKIQKLREIMHNQVKNGTYLL